MNYNLKKDEHLKAMIHLQENIGYVFKNVDLLMESLRHPSYTAEFPEVGPHNQRLEFLGDAVLQLIITNYIYGQFPKDDEGKLTKMRSYLTNETATANYAKKIGLDRLLLLGKGEDAENGHAKSSLVGDLFEAFLGALYCDGGYDKAESFCLSLLPNLEEIIERMPQEENPKGALQELCQEHHLGKPIYEMLSKTGPVHKPVIEMRLVLNGKELGRATAGSQKLAEKQIANEVLKTLKRTLEKMPTQRTIVALDFDGVICDSARETGMSAWKAAKKIWPKLFTRELPNAAEVRAFRKVRPFLETGYHAILLTKMLQEALPWAEYENNLAFHYQRIMDEIKLDKQELIRIFGKTRDEWIDENEAEWLGVHDFFDGVLDALKSLLKSDCQVFILTTKQERFVQATLQSRGVAFPVENIFGLDRKKKKEEHLLNLLGGNPAEIHFVEDRLETLQRIEQVPELACVKLHYATWGYGTEQNHAEASKDKRLAVHTLGDFNRWLSCLK